jgi:hypothetical protein
VKSYDLNLKFSAWQYYHEFLLMFYIWGFLS